MTPASTSAPLLLPLLLLVASASIALALGYGSVPLSLPELWQGLTGGDPLAHSLVLELRLPRALTAFAVGGLLALAGALMQVLLGNPLADPYVLGISGGAAVGALLLLLLGAAGVWPGSGALVGALLATLLVFGLARGRGAWQPERLLLTGVVLASGFGALVNLLLALAPPGRLPGMVFWLLGDLSRASAPLPALGLLLLGLLLALAVARQLDLLTLGDLRAGALGVAVTPLRLHLYFTAALLTAGAVTLGGGIGFVGLVVPHAVRRFTGLDHRRLLPATALAGGALLTVADTLARTLLAPAQLPVGVLTAFIGVPLFLWLLGRRA